MAGALIGALLVGLIRAVLARRLSEFEILAIYLIVIGVLLAQAVRACSESRRRDAGAQRSSCWSQPSSCAWSRADRWHRHSTPTC